MYIKNDLKKQSEDYKLSLRKKKISEFISNKRNLKKRDDNKIKSKYEINDKDINLPEEQKNKKYTNSDLFFIDMLQYLKSNIYEEVKFGILSIRNYFSQEENLITYYNLNIITDIIECLNKYLNDNVIIYQGIWIIINYSCMRGDYILNHLLVTSNCFRIYERIILSNDLDLFSQLLWLFNNITINDNETCFNIILSSLFKYKIIELLQQEIFIINVNENGIFQTIIEEGIKFLRNLLLMNYKIYDCVQDLEILKLKYQIIKILINFMGTNDENNYAKILDSIIIFSDMKNNSYSKEILSIGFIENLIDEKKMFSNKEIILLFNRIIGNFIAVNDDEIILNNIALVDKILNLEYNILSNCNNHQEIKNDCFWIFSNLINCGQLIAEKLMKNKDLIKYILVCLKNDLYENEIKEILILIENLINFISINNFIYLGELGFFDELFVILEKFERENDIICHVFECFFCFLNTGKIISEQTFNKNIIFEEFNKKGGKEYLLKYQNSKKEKLKNIIYYILEIFYKEDNCNLNIEMNN